MSSEEPSSSDPAVTAEQSGKEIAADLSELRRKAALGMYRHYEAAQRNRRLHRVFSVIQIVVNVLLGSALITTIEYSLPSLVKWLAAILAFVVAVIETFALRFNFSGASEGHHKIADDYNRIVERIELTQALFADGMIELRSVARKLSEMHEAYAETRASGGGFLTTDAESRIAHRKFEERERHNSLRKAQGAP
jgi:hypothetical protein